MKTSDRGFKIGDWVRLKSGGPVMTVRAVTEPIRVLTCAWGRPPEKHGFFKPCMILPAHHRLPRPRLLLDDNE